MKEAIIGIVTDWIFDNKIAIKCTPEMADDLAARLDKAIKEMKGAVTTEDGVCPMCGIPMIKRTFNPSPTLRVFGLSLSEILDCIRFKQQHDKESRPLKVTVNE